MIPFLKRLAIRIGFVDKPVEGNERKIHREPIPLTAGIAIFIGFFTTYALFGNAINTKLTAILCGSFIILGIGLVDDWFKTRGKEFPVLPKMVLQVAAAFVVYRAGVVFAGIYNPFAEKYIFFPEWLKLILSITWIFGVTTVINFTDGLDGLAGSLSAISAVTLFIVALAKGRVESAYMAIALLGSALGYLHYNKPPAKIYMGDAGATFLGYILGIIALDGALKQATVLSIFIPVLALGVPIFDNLFVIIKRFTEGKPVYKADASQVHFRLLNLGLNAKQVLVFLCLVNVCFSLISIILLLLNV